MYDIISQISMEAILDKLWIKYSRIGFGSLRLWDGGKLTDWWTLNITDNFVNDFAAKWRAKWWPFAFVKSYLWICDKDVFSRYSSYFGIENKNRNTNKNKKYFNKKRESMKLPKYHNNW